MCEVWFTIYTLPVGLMKDPNLGHAVHGCNETIFGFYAGVSMNKLYQ